MKETGWSYTNSSYNCFFEWHRGKRAGSHQRFSTQADEASGSQKGLVQDLAGPNLRGAFYTTVVFKPVTGEFPSQRANNADFHVSLVWVHISCQSTSRMTGDLRLHDVHVTSSRCHFCIALPISSWCAPTHRPVYMLFLISRDDKVYTTCVAS